MTTKTIKPRQAETSAVTSRSPGLDAGQSRVKGVPGDPVSDCDYVHRIIQIKCGIKHWCDLSVEGTAVALELCGCPEACMAVSIKG
ncbi:hypothetical protein D3C81_1833190 [compost metagenome]